MKKIIIIMMCIVGVLLISGCAERFVCNKPYIIVGAECCLDVNDNAICDEDELEPGRSIGTLKSCEEVGGECKAKSECVGDNQAYYGIGCDEEGKKYCCIPKERLEG